MHTRVVIALVALSLASSGCRAATPPSAPDAMLVEPMTMQPPPSGVTAPWVGVGHRAEGSVRFSMQDGIGRLDFSANFSVSGVPGPVVYLNTTSNANTGRPLRISALKALDGAQSYSFQLPPGVGYAWVLVWCDPYNVPVAEAKLGG